MLAPMLLFPFPYLLFRFDQFIFQSFVLRAGISVGYFAPDKSLEQPACLLLEASDAFAQDSNGFGRAAV